MFKFRFCARHQALLVVERTSDMWSQAAGSKRKDVGSWQAQGEGVLHPRNRCFSATLDTFEIPSDYVIAGLHMFAYM